MTKKSLPQIGQDMMKEGVHPALVREFLDYAQDFEGIADLIFLWDESPDSKEKEAILNDIDDCINDLTNK